ncbi:MAG: DUF523 domain-containing protein [Rhodobacteraceae bacterium]|nr:DUF523 domain-containing protein [Paracoccaceae bacterium]
MDKILVSACIIGRPVRFNETDNLVEHPLMEKWRNEGRLVPLCPEVTAGFSTPRAPAEIEPGSLGSEVLDGIAGVFEDNGTEVSKEFILGAELALETAQKAGCQFALLTDGSPSCGSTYQYSGKFDMGTREGDGVVAALLARNGIQVFSEDRIEQLEAALAEN